MKTAFAFIFAVGLLLTAGCSTRPPAPPPAFTETAAQPDARLAWWREARFGMFIHWGIYSIPGRGEWVQWNEQIPVEEYAKLTGKFNPTNFNADTWASVARDAGMKYMVLTARHHDGFALFNDPGNPFTSASTGVHRDFVAEYVQAVRKAGLHVGLYYSPLDWRFPGFFFPDLQLKSAEAMRDQYHRQMKELMSNYGKIDVVWFDGGESDWLSFNHNMSNSSFPTRKASEHYHGRFSWEGGEVNQMMRRLQPQTIVNNRAADVPRDYTSREGYAGDFDDQQPWETCDTLAGSWGYAGDANPKSLKKCLQLLVNVVGRDGNLLLNIGPRPDGSIVPSQVQRLHEIGEWLDKYGESIYATRGGPFLPGDYGVSTHHDKMIYVHVLKWPEGKLVLPPLPAQIVHAAVLTGGDVSFKQTGQAIELSVPQTNRSDIDTIIALELDQTANGFKPLPVDSKQ
jgi:alpha-L-fucosidase